MGTRFLVLLDILIIEHGLTPVITGDIKYEIKDLI
jgi:hypothetical protein